MYTIDFNVSLKGIDGKPKDKETLSLSLAGFIGSESEGKTLKLYDWYRKLMVGEPLILDQADIDDLKKLIENSKRLYIFIKGQLLDVIEESRRKTIDKP